jgi:hypothetical protein
MSFLKKGECMKNTFSNLWVITRQHYWPDGQFCVEIAFGGRDYSNPDALTQKYVGEFEEFSDPREAVETAVKIWEQWKKDCPKAEIFLAKGCTLGCTIPFVTEGDRGCTPEMLRTWAKREYEMLPKCDRCGDVLPESPWRKMDDWDGEQYCSESCAERAQEALEQEEGAAHE